LAPEPVAALGIGEDKNLLGVMGDILKTSQVRGPLDREQSGEGGTGESVWTEPQQGGSDLRDAEVPVKGDMERKDAVKGVG